MKRLISLIQLLLSLSGTIAFIVLIGQFGALQQDTITVEQYYFNGSCCLLYIALAFALYKVLSKIKKALWYSQYRRAKQQKIHSCSITAESE